MIVVVGSGIAGLSAALKARALGPVALVTKGTLSSSNSWFAQGGIAAALDKSDSPEAHLVDTLTAGGVLTDRSAASALCHDGPARVRELLDLGVPFDRAPGLEAAHSRPRILHAGGDSTGRAIQTALIDAITEADIDVRENTFLSNLCLRDGVVVGVELLNSQGEKQRISADSVILATGGAGQLFEHTTNPAGATGDGVAAAWRAGAVIGDAEFYQFHPTSLAVPDNFLVSEAVRGEGAVLVDESGHRFMHDVHPDAELAPRDVVARGIAAVMDEQGGRPVYLDATRLASPRGSVSSGRGSTSSEFLRARFPRIDEVCRLHGLDWSKEPIPVRPAAHYWMGGVRTDLWGRSSLPGLYVVGEAACTGVHGANRLASNSLLEGLVFAHRTVANIAGRSKQNVAVPGGAGDGGLEQTWPRWNAYRLESGAGAVDRASSHDVSSHGASVLGASVLGATSHDAPGHSATSPDAPGHSASSPAASATVRRSEIQRLMWTAAGLSRRRGQLDVAVKQLEAWHRDDNAPPATGALSVDDQVTTAETRNLSSLAMLVVTAAREREDSIGAHYRADFPPPSSAVASRQHFVKGPTC
ncbi:FAD-dependent oxidoreductase [Saxibacter everestensis]|uniref:L-aspartate oxidase n=1 Tax=Saxibacter everestensis TaxID=2909229 RepID=A0ABY8QPW9_9MICO|nr:FAD-dependent oxidoreductase [Brevibacteriaceae bacterium ZFBP1038]